MRKFLFLNSAQRFSDFALLLMRLFVGLFLIFGVWDNITDAARMQEFAAFLGVTVGMIGHIAAGTAWFGDRKPVSNLRRRSPNGQRKPRSHSRAA